MVKACIGVTYLSTGTVGVWDMGKCACISVTHLATGGVGVAGCRVCQVWSYWGHSVPAWSVRQQLTRHRWCGRREWHTCLTSTPSAWQLHRPSPRMWRHPDGWRHVCMREKRVTMTSLRTNSHVAPRKARENDQWGSRPAWHPSHSTSTHVTCCYYCLLKLKR